MKWPIQNESSYIYKNWFKNIHKSDTFEPIDLSKARIKCQFSKSKQKTTEKNNVTAHFQTILSCFGYYLCVNK